MYWYIHVKKRKSSKLKRGIFPHCNSAKEIFQNCGRKLGVQLICEYCFYMTVYDYFSRQNPAGLPNKKSFCVL